MEKIFLYKECLIEVYYVFCSDGCYTKVLINPEEKHSLTMRFHKLALKHCMPESSNGSTEHTSAALQCYEVTEQWKNNSQLKQTKMNLQNEKLDISANSTEPKGKYKKKTPHKRQNGQKQPCPFSVL